MRAPSTAIIPWKTAAWAAWPEGNGSDDTLTRWVADAGRGLSINALMIEAVAAVAALAASHTPPIAGRRVCHQTLSAITAAAHSSGAGSAARLAARKTSVPREL